MKKHYTEAELKAELDSLTIIADTREQVNDHITDYLDKKKVPVITRKLNVGDYSCQLGDLTLETDVAIERKHNLDELCGNLTADRDRFEREFLRAKALGTKVFLIIEEATWNDVFMANYRSKLSSKSLLASLLSWQARFNVTIIFCSKGNTPAILYSILYYWCRESLLSGGK